MSGRIDTLEQRVERDDDDRRTTQEDVRELRRNFRDDMDRLRRDMTAGFSALREDLGEALKAERSTAIEAREARTIAATAGAKWGAGIAAAISAVAQVLAHLWKSGAPPSP